MNLKRRRVLASALALVVFPLRFDGALAAKRVEYDDAIIQVESYLNSIKTLSARFLQVDSDGNVTNGQLYLRRPGRLRFEYDDPSPLLIVADGIWLILHDRELGQVSRYPLYGAPLGALVDEPANLREKVEVVRVEQGLGGLRIMVVDRANPDEGWIDITFTEPPLLLRQWKVRDAQGGTIELSLTDIRVNQKLDPNLFFFEDPPAFKE